MSGGAMGAESPPGLVGRFATELQAVGGCCHRVPDDAAAQEAVAGLCDGGLVAAHMDPVLEGLTGGLRTVADAWSADVGLTSAVAAAAETGTLAMAYDRDRPRSVPLVPPVHIAVVPAARLVDSYADAVAALSGLDPLPSGMQLISGPSSSGDIEMVPVRGMHGPLALHVVLVG